MPHRVALTSPAHDADDIDALMAASAGLIEGVESTEHDRVVGIRWHPDRHEAEASNHDPNIRILEAFAQQVRASQP